MKSQLQKDFHQFLESGAYCKPPGRAACALRSAKTLEQWRDYESAGLVRLRVEPEQENYFDVYGKPDTERERLQLEAALERDGCWFIVSEVNHGNEAIGDQWEIADSIGMCVYSNPLCPFENCYVVDLMAKAIESVPQPGEV